MAGQQLTVLLSFSSTVHQAISRLWCIPGVSSYVMLSGDFAKSIERNHMTLRSVLLLISVMLSLTACSYGVDPVNLADLDGWDIVVAEDAIPSENYAAEEFQTFFAQASGLKLPIVSAINRPDRHIFIGPSQTMQASTLGFGVAQFAPEDLRIVARDNNIVLAGGRPRGTLYAVYTFLEDYLGVRFLTPEHTHVPPIGDWRVVGPVDRFYHPPFNKYRYSCYLTVWANPAFAVRTRNNTVTDDPKLGGKTPYSLINHSFYRQLPTEKYAQDHPEYFCLVDGRRLVDPGKDLQGNNPCYANPDVLDIVTQAVFDEIEGPKGLVTGRLDYAVSQNDRDGTYCRCPQCSAIDKREGSPVGAILDFVNRVADRVAAKYPEVSVGTLAYNYSRRPPLTLRPRDNVTIWLCSIEASQLYPLSDTRCPLNTEFMENLRGWRKMCDELSVWSYYINFGDALRPHPNLYTIKPNILAFLANGVDGSFMQCAHWPLPATEMSDLRNYLICNLMWNPARDTEALIDEFVNLHYGQAAPPIRRFINRIHRDYHPRVLAEQSGEQECHGFVIDEPLANECFAAFEEAMDLAENDIVKSRVEKASLCAYRACFEPLKRLRGEERIDPKLADRLRPLVSEFMRLCKKYGLTEDEQGKPGWVRAFPAGEKYFGQILDADSGQLTK